MARRPDRHGRGGVGDLTSENGWGYTWDDLPENGEYALVAGALSDTERMYTDGDRRCEKAKEVRRADEI